jgi:thiol-disulfide isomerase/thioredoxin/protocatechuate 3,4-dioxygenase beta subunit
MSDHRHRFAVVVLVLLVVNSAFCLAADGPNGHPPDSRSMGRLSGRIVDSGGKPLAGATVQLHYHDRAAHQWKDAWRSSKSTGDGRYDFEGLPGGEFAVSADVPGLAKGWRRVSLEEGQKLDGEIKLDRPVRVAVRVHDREGKPIAGARVGVLGIKGPNGEFWISDTSYEPDRRHAFSVELPHSDAAGRLMLPTLAEGSLVSFELYHGDFAPALVSDFRIREKSLCDAVMTPGVRISISVLPRELAARARSLGLFLMHVPLDHPSTFISWPLDVDKEGMASFRVEAGSYSLFRLDHEDFFISPKYSRIKADYFEIGPGKNDRLTVHLEPKVPIRGRVIDEKNGRPLADRFVKMLAPNLGFQRGPGRPGYDWIFVGSPPTNQNGEYTARVPAGPLRLLCSGDNYTSHPDALDVSISASRSTKIPDIRVGPTPWIAGQVLRPDGTPAGKTIVRIRGGEVWWIDPVVTDADGRFEIHMPFVPVDDDTGKQLSVQELVAFHAYEPLAARMEIHLDQPGSLRNLVLGLAPAHYDSSLVDINGEMTAFEKNDLSAAVDRAKANEKLRSQLAPELDCCAWLNVPPGTKSLRDFRGKYVLLDFWTTWCGPCRGTYPEVQLAYDLYSNQGFTVIGVHDNSVLPEAVREFVRKEKMRVPIAIDRADGRTLAAYAKCGINGYPGFILVGPDGRILCADGALPGPSLRKFRLELIRDFVMGRRQTAKK